MKETTLIISILFLSFSAFCQDSKIKKWNSQLFLDLNASNKTTYSYTDAENIGREIQLNGRGSIEVAYNLDYRLLKKLALTGVVGFTNYNSFFGSLKTGAGLKLLYIEDSYHYLTLQYGYHIPLGVDDFREGHQIRIGQVFDVANIFNKRLLLGVYYISDFFYTNDANPLINGTAKSSSLKATAYGISLGIKF